MSSSYKVTPSAQTSVRASTSRDNSRPMQFCQATIADFCGTCVSQCVVNSLLSVLRKQEITLDLEAIKQALNLEKAVEGADLAINRFKLQVT